MTMTDTTHTGPAGGTVLVTGGTGKTGRHVAALLRDRGVDVRAASRHGDRTATTTVFDWHRAETYDPALAGVDRIYLVQPAGVPDASPLVSAFLSRAADAGVRAVVLLSALGVDVAGEEVGFRRVERVVMGSGLEWTLLRPNWFMQNFSSAFWLATITRRGEIPAPTADARVSFIDARDIAAVAVAALVERGHAGAEYALTGAEAVPFSTVAQAIGDVVGSAVRHVDVTDDEMREVIGIEGLPADYVEGLLGLFGGIRAGWNAVVTDTVDTVTGRAPITVAQYVKDHADVWRDDRRRR
jgi:uncharacterized protein YbjT (DUF2867 family)